jgi:SAM-dependent methyltransferase
MKPWVVLLILLGLASLHYINLVLEERLFAPYRKQYKLREGFDGSGGGADAETIAGAVDETSAGVKWLSNDELYDEFYCSVYDQLSQGSVRNQAEVGLILHEWTKRGDDLKTFRVLDVGSATGITVASLAKMGVKKAVGLDKSAAMLKQAQTKTIPQTTLTDEQKRAIEWRNTDVINPSACSPGEFTHATLLYFTIYYFRDKEAIFRNLFLWVAPGGRLVVMVVNKHKFDPMLESASPWLGFSLQKYTDTRITKSEVDFNKFKYIGEFDLQDPEAEYRETFRFKDGKVRRQRHSWLMEDMNTIVGFAKAAGWEYLGYTDLTPIGFEYAYHLHFKRPV